MENVLQKRRMLNQQERNFELHELISDNFDVCCMRVVKQGRTLKEVMIGVVLYKDNIAFSGSKLHCAQKLQDVYELTLTEALKMLVDMDKTSHFNPQQLSQLRALNN